MSAKQRRLGPLFHRPVSPRRPLASATAALRASSQGSSSSQGRSSPARSRHGAELLPELLDFEGAVQLAQALETTPSAASASWGASEAIAIARQRLASAERDVRRPLSDPRTGASFAAPDRIAHALERAGVPATRQRKAIASAAHDLFAPLETQMLRRITAVRQLVAEVRREIAPTIAASAPNAARLEQIDAALGQATSARSDALFSRAIVAMRDAFAADLEVAVLALPKPCDEVPLATWASPSGPVGEHVARCEAFVVASFLHERARLDMLVRNTLGERLA